MERYINEHGVQCWAGVTLDSPFQPDIFHEVEMRNNPDFERDNDWQVAFHCDLGSITIINRLTGYGWNDTETGFRDKDGRFWLASGGIDVRESECKTIGEAIEWIKKNSPHMCWSSIK